MFNLKLRNKLGACIAVFFLFLISNIFIPGYFNGFSLDPAIDIFELWKNSNSTIILQDRLSDPVFSLRIFVLYFQDFLLNKIGIPAQASFTLINLFSFAGIVILLNKIAKVHFSQSKNSAYIGIFLFIFSMPIMFAFSGYTASYDDFPQYFFILLSFNFVLTKDYILMSIAFFISLTIRETSFIFLIPFIFWNKSDISKKAIYLSISIFLFLLYVYSISAGNQTEALDFLKHKRFTGWTANFRNWKSTIEVFFCLIIVLGLPVTILLKTTVNNIRNYLILITILINTSIVIVTAILHETRLLLLPLLLFYPLIGKYFELVIDWKSILKPTIISKYLFITILTLALYHPSEGRSAIIYKIYAIPHLFMLFDFSNFFRRKKINFQSKS